MYSLIKEKELFEVSTKRKYIESHWLVFGIKGAIAALAGLCLTLTTKENTEYLTAIVGCTMLGLALVELFNMLHRKRRQHTWGASFAISLIELVVAIFLLFTVKPNASASDTIALRVSVLSAYTLVASVIAIMLAFSGFQNTTDRTMWVIDGVIGCVLAFAMFNGLDVTTHIKIFGIYLLVKGLTDMYFGAHSREEMAELHAEKAAKKELPSKKKGKK